MVVVQTNYASINEPKMTDSFLLHLNDIKSVYDISKGSIGIKFYRRASINEYRIDLRDDCKHMLASDLLALLINHDAPQDVAEIRGDVNLK